VIHITGPVKNTNIYNNLILVKPKSDAQIDRTLVKMDNWGEIWPENTLFKNNFFIVDGEAGFELGKDTGTVFENNVYIGNIKNLPEDKTTLNIFLPNK
jgi:mannose-6-phosphate isomerase-like protein (cupin superfamily)